MTAVTWVELPPDAPEPPPLSVVRDAYGDWWIHTGLDVYPWRCAGGAADAKTLRGERVSWARLQVRKPLSLGQPEGVLWPLVDGVEPSPYEVRQAALTAAVQLYYGERDDPAEVIGAARVFEPYLRGEEWPGQSDGRARPAVLDDPRDHSVRVGLDDAAAAYGIPVDECDHRASRHQVQELSPGQYARVCTGCGTVMERRLTPDRDLH